MSLRKLGSLLWQKTLKYCTNLLYIPLLIIAIITLCVMGLTLMLIALRQRQ